MGRAQPLPNPPTATPSMPTPAPQPPPAKHVTTALCKGHYPLPPRIEEAFARIEA